jgi:predicted nuclease of restriction endonuclease-like (RecB) superfamily
MSELKSPDYAKFFHEIKGYIRDRQLQSMRSVNRELVALYWDIGQLIHQKQEALGWGKSVVETLAKDLQAEFPGRNGFSANNLWLMRQFYCEYVDKPNLQSLIGEISWTKNLVVFGRCKNDLEREYALRNAVRPIGVATYSIVPQLPEAYRDELPSPEAIAERLRLWDDREVGDE